MSRVRYNRVALITKKVMGKKMTKEERRQIKTVNIIIAKAQRMAVKCTHDVFVKGRYASVSQVFVGYFEHIENLGRDILDDKAYNHIGYLQNSWGNCRKMYAEEKKHYDIRTLKVKGFNC